MPHPEPHRAAAFCTRCDQSHRNNELPTDTPYDLPWEVYLENEHDPMDGLWTTIYAPDAEAARRKANQFYGRPYAVKSVRRRTGAAA